MNKAERAIKALDECANALDDLPDGLRSRILFGASFSVSTDTLRREARIIESRLATAIEAMSSVTEAMEESNPMGVE